MNNPAVTIEAKCQAGTQGERNVARSFSGDLDAAFFEGFDRYKRWYVKLSEQRGKLEKPADTTQVFRQPTVTDCTRLIQGLLKEHPDAVRRFPELADPKTVRHLAREYMNKVKRQAPKAEKRRREGVAALLRKFEACQFSGPSDWIYRLSFKDSLREVLLEYISEPKGRVHLCDDRVMVPTAYTLSGELLGPFEVLTQTQDIRRLVTEVLVWRARRALGLLWVLAEAGDNRAMQRLAQVIVPFVKAINERACSDATVLGKWPKELPFWPVLKSPHHDFDCDHRALLRSLQIGKDFPFTIAEGARWKARDAIGKWAIHLCQEIEIMQDGHPVDDDSEPWEHKLDALRPFSSETWKGWWEVAKGLLVHDYIDVVEIPELNATVKSKADQKSPGRVRKRIFQALKDKFKSMAWENKFK
jgi:hypothetical protein